MVRDAAAQKLGGIEKFRLNCAMFDPRQTGVVTKVSFGTALYRWGLMLTQEELDGLFEHEAREGRATDDSINYLQFIADVVPKDAHPNGHTMHLGLETAIHVEAVDTAGLRAKMAPKEVVDKFLDKVYRRFKGNASCLRVREFFKELDVGNTGFLRVDEFRTCLHKLGLNLKDEELQAALDYYGDGRGRLSYIKMLAEDPPDFDTKARVEAPIPESWKKDVNSISSSLIMSRLRSKIEGRWQGSVALAKARSVFRLYDPSGSGVVNLQSFSAALTSIGFPLSRKDVQQFYDSLRKGRRGVDYMELLNELLPAQETTELWVPADPNTIKRDPIDAWHTMPRDRDNVIQLMRTKLAAKTSAPLGSYKMHEIFKFHDSNRDGKLTWPEFRAAMEALNIVLEDSAERTVYSQLAGPSGQVEYVHLLQELNQIEYTSAMVTPSSKIMMRKGHSGPATKSLSLQEWASVLADKISRKSSGGMASMRVRRAMNFDVNAQGLITPDAFYRGLKGLDVQMSHNDAMALFDLYDEDGDVDTRGGMTYTKLLPRILGPDYADGATLAPKGKGNPVMKQRNILRARKALTVDEIEDAIQSKFEAKAGSNRNNKLRSLLGIAADGSVSQVHFQRFLQKIALELKPEEYQALLARYEHLDLYAMLEHILLPRKKAPPSSPPSGLVSFGQTRSPSKNVPAVRPLSAPQMHAKLREKIQLRLSRGDDHVAARAVLRSADDDRDGLLNKPQLNEALKAFGLHLTPQELDELFHRHAVSTGRGLRLCDYEDLVVAAVGPAADHRAAGTFVQGAPRPKLLRAGKELDHTDLTMEEVLAMLRQKIDQKTLGPAGGKGIAILTLFRHFDSNNDGFLTMTEFQRVVENLGVAISPSVLHDTFDYFGTNAKGDLRYRDVIDYLMKPSTGLLDFGHEGKKIRTLEQEGGGARNVDVKNLTHTLLSKLAARVPGGTKELTRHIKYFDYNQDGWLSRTEFDNIIKDVGMHLRPDEVTALLTDGGWQVNRKGEIPVSELMVRVRELNEGTSLDLSEQHPGERALAHPQFSVLDDYKPGKIGGEHMTVAQLRALLKVKVQNSHSLRVGLKSTLARLRHCDRDNDGRLTHEEFQEAILRLGLPAPLGVLSELFYEFDPDDTGFVNYHDMIKELELPDMDMENPPVTSFARPPPASFAASTPQSRFQESQSRSSSAMGSRPHSSLVRPSTAMSTASDRSRRLGTPDSLYRPSTPDSMASSFSATRRPATAHGHGSANGVDLRQAYYNETRGQGRGVQMLLRLLRDSLSQKGGETYTKQFEYLRSFGTRADSKLMADELLFANVQLGLHMSSAEFESFLDLVDPEGTGLVDCHELVTLAVNTERPTGPALEREVGRAPPGQARRATSANPTKRDLMATIRPTKPAAMRDVDELIKAVHDKLYARRQGFVGTGQVRDIFRHHSATADRQWLTPDELRKVLDSLGITLHPVEFETLRATFSRGSMVDYIKLLESTVDLDYF